MSRRTRILMYVFMISLLLSGVAAVRYLKSAQFQTRLRQLLVARLEEKTGSHCSIRSVQLQLLPPRLNIDDLKLQAETNPPTAPFLEVKSIWLRFGMGSLFGKVWLSSATILNPQIRIVLNPDGSSNLPHPPSTVGNVDVFAVRVDQLTIANGAFEFNAHPFHLDTTMQDFSLATHYDGQSKAYDITVAYEKGALRWDNHRWEYGMATSFRLTPQQLELERLNLRCSAASLDVKGSLQNFLHPGGRFQYQGRVPLTILSPFYPEEFALSGEIQLAGNLELDETNWKSAGKLKGNHLLVGGARVDSIASLYEVNPDQLVFNNVQISGMRGKMEGSFRVGDLLGARRYQGNLSLQGIDLLDLSQVAQLKQYPFAGLLSGKIDAHWEEGWKNFAGTGHLDITEAAADASSRFPGKTLLPLTGRLDFDIEEKSLAFQDSYVQWAGSRMNFSGKLARGGASHLNFDLASQNLRDFEAFGINLGGKAHFHGQVAGSLHEPMMEGNLEVEDFTYHRYSLDRLSGYLNGDAHALQWSRLVVEKGQSKIPIQGTIYWDPHQFLKPAALELQATLANVSSADLLSALGRTQVLTGILNGKCSIAGTYPDVDIRGQINIRHGSLKGQPFDSARFTLHYLDSVLDFSGIAMRIGAGQLAGEGSVDLEQETLQASLTMKQVVIEHISQIQAIPLTGRLSSPGVKIDGPLRFPNLEGELQIDGAKVSGVPYGNFQIVLHTADRRLNFNLHSLASEAPVQAAGSIVLDGDNLVDVKGSFRNLNLTPYLRQSAFLAPRKASGQMDASFSVAGPLSQVEQMKVDCNVNALRIQTQTAYLESTRPFEFRYQGSVASIYKASFASKGTALNVDGNVDLSKGNKLDLTLEGNFDLALLGDLFQKLAVKGEGRLNANLRGTLSDPRIKGALLVSNGQLAYSSLPNSLSDINATLNFDENQVKLDKFTATSGGGKIQATGNLVFGQNDIKSINLRLTGHEVRLRYPEGVRNLMNADLQLRGNLKSQLLSGQINVLSTTFQKDSDPLTLYLEKRHTNVSSPGTSDLGESLGLDLMITSDRNIRLDSRLLKVTMGANLRVKGTTANPVLLGNMEASEGDLFFQGSRYRITRGRLDFSNPVRIDPYIDFEAETDIRDYRVIFTASGTLDKFRANLRSEPPLSTVDLYNLITGGVSSTDSLHEYSSSDQFIGSGLQQDQTASANALLSEGLSLKMSSRMKRIFGIDRFQVDPGFLDSQNRGGARVTVGQQITKDLSVTYSTNVSAGQQPIIMVEYNLNNSSSIIATRDADGYFAIDLHFRKHLRQKR